MREDWTTGYTDGLVAVGRMKRLNIPGAGPRGSERAELQGAAAVTSEGGIPGRKTALPASAIISQAIAAPPSNPSNVVTHIVGLARFAGYGGLLTIVIVSLVPGEWRPTIGLPKALEHAIAYSLVAAFLTLVSRARWPHILLLVALAGVLEIGQAWVPGRDSNPIDFLGSAAGALFGFGFSSLLPTQISRFSRARTLDSPMTQSLPFPLRVAVIILAVGAATVVLSIVAAHGGVAGWLGAGLALIMLAIAVVDAQHFLIPNSLNAAGLALGIVHSVVVEQEDVGAALADAVLRAAVLALAFFALRLIYARLRRRQGIGLGDVKLAAVAGSWLNWPIMPITVEIAALSALSVYALRRYALRRPVWPTSRIPFGFYFAPAIWIGWLLQTTILQAW